MGHWYIGSHLFAVIIISFFTQNLFTMYAMGSSIQRTFMISIFYALLSGIISLIGILTHSGFINWLDFGLEVILLCPLIQWLFSFATKRRPKADLIF
jgi:cell shape-determining protein MreD